MRRRRIFVSHSTKDSTTPAEAAAREVQETLVKALEATGEFSVLLDRLKLRPGDAWRARINLWVGGCDAAVVLLSERALTSHYVAYESSILSYRNSYDTNFLLIPVLVDPVDLPVLSASTLGLVQQLDESQFVSGTPEQIAEAVLRQLQRSVCVESPVEQRARRLVTVMKNVPEEWIEEAAKELGMEHLDVWLPGDSYALRLRLAVQLMSAGMDAAIDAGLVLRPYLADDVAVQARLMEELMALVSSSWVDIRSARQIPRVVHSETGAYALRLNAQRDTTARMYVTCALPGPGKYYLAPCNGVFGERPVSALISEVRAALVAELKTSEDDLPRDLQKLPPRQPILVTLDSRGISSEVLTALRTEFPNVVFFLLAGGGGGYPLSDAEVEVLIPELQPGDEDALTEQYDDFHRQLRVRR